jgi:hypothetical protein
MKEYHKIQSVFKRDEKTKRFILGDWSLPELEYLKDLSWEWDEKIDGTNIRVHWESGNRTFGGRTANASIPATLVKRLEELFTVEKLRASFGDGPATLYGEGFGAKIQSGGNYIPDGQDFILFDVQVGEWWLTRPNVSEIAGSLGLRLTTIVGDGPLSAAIEFVKAGFKSAIGTADAEGIVCRPKVQLFNRKGERIIVKVKTKDFAHLSNEPTKTLGGEK